LATEKAAGRAKKPFVPRPLPFLLDKMHSSVSILIPIFNFDVRPLVNDLHGQCEACAIAYEILCFDDGSTPQFKMLNKEIWKLPNVIYRDMPQNLGRSAIRNALSRAARFEQLLFMDCDSKVVSTDFIKNYLTHAAPNCLVYGGRCYQASPPTMQRFVFTGTMAANGNKPPPPSAAAHPTVVL